MCVQVCGISYKQGERSNLLPAVPADEDRVPDSYILQLVKKPKPRQERKPITRFQLLTAVGTVMHAQSCQVIMQDQLNLKTVLLKQDQLGALPELASC